MNNQKLKIAKEDLDKEYLYNGDVSYIDSEIVEIEQYCLVLKFRKLRTADLSYFIAYCLVNNWALSIIADKSIVKVIIEEH